MKYDLALYSPLLALLLIYVIAFLLSEHRKEIHTNRMLVGIGVQFLIGVLVTKVSLIVDFFGILSAVFTKITQVTSQGIEAVFGSFGLSPEKNKLGFMLAIHGFPSLIVVSTISGLLLRFGILQRFMVILSGFYRYVMNVSLLRFLVK